MKGDGGVPGAACEYTKRARSAGSATATLPGRIERAFRITQLPLAFTEGFSPHPLVSFGLALATGNESDAEYLDLVLAEPSTSTRWPRRSTEALPEGIEVTGAAALVDRAPALQEAVTAVAWRVEIEPTPDAVRAHCGRPCCAHARDTTRHRKGREVTEDVRPVVRSINAVRRHDGRNGIEHATPRRQAR